MGLGQTWGEGAVPLPAVIRHAGELLHPKSHAGNYPCLRSYPSLKVLANELVRAHVAGESERILEEIALELLRVMQAARQPPGEKSTRPANEILYRPDALREREQALGELRRKALKARTHTPMPTLLDLPAAPKPTPARASGRAFFEEPRP